MTETPEAAASPEQLIDDGDAADLNAALSEYIENGGTLAGFVAVMQAEASE